MSEIKTNKLSIYLIKEEYTNPKDIFKNYEGLKNENIQGVGDFYHGVSHVSAPSWIRKFFAGSFDNTSENERFKIFSASAKAVFLITSESRTFALTFGYGHTMLNPGVWEERFGLKVVLNVIDPENLRSIDKKNMSIIPKLSKEQITKDGKFADFGIDIEQDLIQGITAKSKDEDFGQTITGKAALSVSVKFDCSNIKTFLKKCYELYKSDQYKEEFGWIDNIFETKDPKIIESLDKILLERIMEENFNKTWMSIPQIIEWEKVSEFKFKTNSFGSDIDLPKYLKFLKKEGEQSLSLSILKKQLVRCIGTNAEETICSWKIYDCLYSEIELENKIYILSNGNWYQIETEFETQVRNSFNSFTKNLAKISLPQCRAGEHEDKYNQRVSEESEDICNMDEKLIYHGGANQQIEFCDLFTKNKELIHVKHYGASSVLSHLFAQGLVSGELLLSDHEFRKKLNDKLPDEYKLNDVERKPESSEYKIIYAIISKSNNDFDIPFFSKVNIKNARKKLEGFGYSVSFLKISTISETE